MHIPDFILLTNKHTGPSHELFYLGNSNVLTSSDWLTAVNLPFGITFPLETITLNMANPAKKSKECSKTNSAAEYFTISQI